MLATNNVSSRTGDDDVHVLINLCPIFEAPENWGDTLDCEGGI